MAWGNWAASAARSLAARCLEVPGNIAGLLQFCIKNNFLKGEESSSVKDKLMGKLGGTPAPDSGYAQGAQGLLKSGDGKQLDLSGGGLQAQASKQVCDRVLSQAKSLL